MPNWKTQQLNSSGETEGTKQLPNWKTQYLNNSETEKYVDDVAETEKSYSKPPVNMRPLSWKTTNGKSRWQTNIVAAHSREGSASRSNNNLENSSSNESSNSNSERASTISSEIMENVELTEEESAVLSRILNMGDLDKPIPAENKCDNNKLETNNYETYEPTINQVKQNLSRNSSSSR